MQVPHRPLLPSHFAVWFDPPDEAGDEALHVVSERRSIRLKGQSFREFCQKVVPLLDGRHTVAEIQAKTAEVFRPQDLVECLELLAAQGILVESQEEAFRPDMRQRMAPQLNLFHDLAPGHDVQRRLAAATVAVLGLGGAGAATALMLAAAGVGTVRCIDWLAISSADAYFSPFLGLDRVGASRATTVAALIAGAAPQVQAPSDERPIENEDDIRRAVAGAGLVVCCLDASQSNLVFKLNRVCLADRINWIAYSLSGVEIVVGPSMHPGDGPCYLCYRMRIVACAGNPEEAFAYERYLDRRKRDESGRRENLVFGASIAAGLLGNEVVKELTGLAEPSLVGRILTMQLTDLAMQRHTVLRKPWCPACFPAAQASHGA